MKILHELVDSTNKTWHILQDWLAQSKGDIKVEPALPKGAEHSLTQLQVSTKSLLGTIIYHTGGIIVNHGSLRILGSGSKSLRNICDWNQINENGVAKRLKGALLVADDIYGGFFAMNAGAFQGKRGNIFYLAPDTLEWEDLEMEYSQFINWTINGDVDRFYETMRWKNWQDELKNINGFQGLLIYPFLWAEGPAFEERMRKVVPIDELWALTMDNFNRLSQ